MKKPIYIAFSIISILLLLGGYLFFAKRYPLLPGYHEFFYTPQKYKQTILNLKRQDLLTDFKKIVPFWLGTRYGFHGQTHVPGEGKIACGYFVTTVLEDLGYQIERNKLAQLPSEEMIKILTNRADIERFSQKTIIEFVESVRLKGKGLYVVGLDTHTGFVLNDETGIWFIHSSGSLPLCVVKQKAMDSKILQKSKYRVLGKLQ